MKKSSWMPPKSTLHTLKWQHGWNFVFLPSCSPWASCTVLVLWVLQEAGPPIHPTATPQPGTLLSITPNRVSPPAEKDGGRTTQSASQTPGPGTRGIWQTLNVSVPAPFSPSDSARQSKVLCWPLCLKKNLHLLPTNVQRATLLGFIPSQLSFGFKPIAIYPYGQY